MNEPQEHIQNRMRKSIRICYSICIPCQRHHEHSLKNNEICNSYAFLFSIYSNLLVWAMSKHKISNIKREKAKIQK